LRTAASITPRVAEAHMVHAYAHASWRAAAPRQTSTTARKHNRKPCFDGAAPAAARASRRAEAARHVVAAASDTSSAAPSSPKVSTGPGRQTYKPASYSVLVSDAVTALQAAIADGHTLCEIEFPPLPSKTDCALHYGQNLTAVSVWCRFQQPELTRAAPLWTRTHSLQGLLRRLHRCQHPARTRCRQEGAQAQHHHTDTASRRLLTPPATRNAALVRRQDRPDPRP